MNKVREQATLLRKKGYSYNEIHRKLGVPKGTLSGWFSDMLLSKKAQKRLDERKGIGTDILIRRNIAQTDIAWRKARKTRNQARAQINKLAKKDLFTLGISLYWAEGHKKLMKRNGKEITSHVISFTNSDPEMIQCFVVFLKTFFPRLKDAEIHISMRLFDHINEKTALAYWQKATNLPKTCFSKPSYIVSKSSQGKRPYNRLPYGTIQVRVNSTEKFHTLMGWVEGIKKQFKI